MFRWTCNPALRIFKNTKQCLSSVSTTTAIIDKLRQETNKNEIPTVGPNSEGLISEEEATKSQLVAAAFAKLKKKTLTRRASESALDEMISGATSPNELLALTETSSVSRRQALKIVALLAEWSIKGKVDPDKYETDKRFISLCQLVGCPIRQKVGKEPSRVSDLSVVLGVTGDEEAAKLVSNISLQQMIKVMSSLAAKRRRSTPLLKSLAFNIGSSTAKIDVKQGADILFSLATLNFPDEILLEKVCADLCECVSKCQKTAVIGSIATSLGLLKYKHSGLLNNLCDWMVRNNKIYRMQDISSLIQTLAVVNEMPRESGEFFQEILPKLTKDNFPTALIWLDLVWSLVVLEKADHHNFESVLMPEFLSRLSAQTGGLSISARKKLLNINGTAKWLKGYQGALLGNEFVSEKVPLIRAKEKQILVNSVLDALSNLLPSSIYLRPDVDLGMGFLIDAECLVDAKMTPLPVIDKKTGEPSSKPQKGTRIAVMVWDYHDFTRGETELCGLAKLIERITFSSGYKVLSVPFNEYNQGEKLVTRVQYLEKKMRALVKPG